MADLQTILERLGSLTGKKICWLGDGNNVANSWIEAATLFGFELWLAGPEAYRPPAALLAWAWAKGANITLTEDPVAAATDASVIVTDVWVSMGDEQGSRERDMQPFKATAKLMETAQPDAIFLHCLPAIRGQEVEAEVIDGPQSAVFDEAENRLHAQKAIMAYIISENF
jgi:ornithine carbamoyltransferase